MAARDQGYHPGREDSGARHRPAGSRELSMGPIRPTSVEVETSLHLRASLKYDPTDPYAVHVMFHPDTSGAEPVSWSFARELLVTGIDEAAGMGDVRVWPWA